MIKLEELNPHHFPTTPEIDSNLRTLWTRVSMVRARWDQPLYVTSGFRTKEDHLRIYREKAAQAQEPFYESKVPMTSKHLVGAACDISDPDLKLTQWLQKFSGVLEESQLWCEKGNADWVHFQIFPPWSGKRWFYP